MARFDVHSLRDNGALVVICQADALGSLETCFVIPLMPRADTRWSMPRLAPVVAIGNDEYVLAIPLAAAVPQTMLGPIVGSLAHEDLTILNAFDMLVSGI
ncbi:MAG: CcdB family protein [Sphingomonas sp.]|uniref:CcdB family protein n=1 Tax=Sphingomonas sp. TaxID=28214 RepID=UPI001832A90D|nr:CcdB family protein [Sphingomonas sp.]MBA3666876.1 CcdB family protein [Sphingomonas sp.]